MQESDAAILYAKNLIDVYKRQPLRYMTGTSIAMPAAPMVISLILS